MGASAIALLALTALVPSGGGRIIAEWSPGIPEANLGGELVVDGYGIGGLGAYRIAFDDGTTTLAVCIQADIGHSLSAVYVADRSVAVPAELGYLAWAYLGDRPATDVEAAAVNLLAWRYTAAQRRAGGAVWQGDDVEVRVLGVGRLHDVEEAAVRLHGEAMARRGPWSFVDAAVGGSTASVRIVGPGGPIAGASVMFEDDGGWSSAVVTGEDGGASAEVPVGVTTVSVRAAGPGDAVVLLADGSQGLAMAGPPAALVASLVVPPTTTTPTTTTPTTTPPATTTTPSSTTTTTTTTTTTSSTTTTTTVPSTTTTTTVPSTTTTTPSTTTTTTVPSTTTTMPDTTTSSTTTTTAAIPATTTTAPPPPTSPPPTLPPTGSGSRGITRIGAGMFAAGAFAVLWSVRRRPAGAGHRRPSSP